ncbi:uncharacterized protein, partial [Clytia hemisphaerica]|uniref:uncharacterized protein n=1 Tax=Clytia hemisphaerica TaxID=252671 RepID=UPI0034D7254D
MPRKLMKFGKSEIERYKKLTNGKNFTKIATESTADTNKKYKQWENELKKSAKLCFKKVSINKYSRQDPEIARMMKRKRKLKKAGGDDPINRIRDRLINEQIEKLLCEQQKRKVDKTVQKIIEAGGVNSPEFWGILKVKSKKQETRCAMKDKNGNLKETEEEIQKVYQDHYNELLKTPSAASKEEEDAEKEVEENFDLLKRAAENNIESEEITMEELNTAIKQLKKKKAADIGETPYGKTEEIIVEEVVRQGTIWGPFLCSITTEKINRVGERVYTPYENVRLEPMVFVDDICEAGDLQQIKTIVKNCKIIESKKKMTFNNKKSKLQRIKLSKKRKRNPAEKINNTVKRGEIDYCDQYKYLGEEISDSGRYEQSIEKKEKK